MVRLILSFMKVRFDDDLEGGGGIPLANTHEAQDSVMFSGSDDDDDDGSALFQPSRDDVTNIDDQVLQNRRDDDTEDEEDDKSIHQATVKINNLEKSAQSLENWLERMVCRLIIYDCP